MFMIHQFSFNLLWLSSSSSCFVYRNYVYIIFIILSDAPQCGNKIIIQGCGRIDYRGGTVSDYEWECVLVTTWFISFDINILSMSCKEMTN